MRWIAGVVLGQASALFLYAAHMGSIRGVGVALLVAAVATWFLLPDDEPVPVLALVEVQRGWEHRGYEILDAASEWRASL